MTDDLIQKHGFSLASCCSFCSKDVESVSNMFMHCPFILDIWNWLAALFCRHFVPIADIQHLFIFPPIILCLLHLKICGASLLAMLFGVFGQ